MRPSTEGPQHPIALIDLGPITIGIDVLSLREVMPINGPLQHFSSTAPGLCGCVALRGQIVPVVDICPLLGHPPLDETGEAQVVVLIGDMRRVYGILAREALQIVQPRDVQPQAIDSAKVQLREQILPGLALIDGKAVHLLDPLALPQLGVPCAQEQRPDKGTRGSSREFIVFQVEESFLAIALAGISATIPTTPIGNDVLHSGCCDGAIERHGVERALLSPLRALGLPHDGARPTQAAAVVVPFAAGGSVALRADRVIDIMSISEDDITPIHPALCQRTDMVHGIHVDEGGREITVIDFKMFCEDPDLRIFASLEQRHEGSKGALAGQKRHVRRLTALRVQAGGPLAFDISEILEILPVPETIDPCAGYGGFIGTIIYRKRMSLPIFALAALQGGQPEMPCHASAIAVVRINGNLVGLYIDQILAVEQMGLLSETPERSGARLVERPGGDGETLWAMFPVDSFYLPPAC